MLQLEMWNNKTQKGTQGIAQGASVTLTVTVTLNDLWALSFCEIADNYLFHVPESSQSPGAEKALITKYTHFTSTLNDVHTSKWLPCLKNYTKGMTRGSVTVSVCCAEVKHWFKELWDIRNWQTVLLLCTLDICIQGQKYQVRYRLSISQLELLLTTQNWEQRTYDHFLNQFVSWHFSLSSAHYWSLCCIGILIKARLHLDSTTLTGLSP